MKQWLGQLSNDKNYLAIIVTHQRSQQRLLTYILWFAFIRTLSCCGQHYLMGNAFGGVKADNAICKGLVMRYIATIYEMIHIPNLCISLTGCCGKFRSMHVHWEANLMNGKRVFFFLTGADLGITSPAAALALVVPPFVFFFVIVPSFSRNYSPPFPIHAPQKISSLLLPPSPQNGKNEGFIVYKLE